MREKILTEISEACEFCEYRECCREDDCTLFRIEQLVEKWDKLKGKENEEIRRY